MTQTRPKLKGSRGAWLVTGGCGFIGRTLVRRLADAGHKVVVLDDESSATADLLPKAPNVSFIKGSVTDPQTVERAGAEVDGAFHLAGIVGMRLAKAHAERAFDVSAQGTENLLKVMGDRLCVLFSSSAVYGIDGMRPMTEDDTVTPEQAFGYDGGKRGYAAGKLEMERLAEERDPQKRRALIIRPFNVIGPGQSSRYGMVVPSFIERARRGLPIHVYGDGTQTRCFSDIEIVIDCMLGLTQSFQDGTLRHRTFNVGCDEPTRILDLAALVRRLTGSQSPIVHVPYEEAFPGARDCMRRLPDLSRLNDALGAVAWPDIEAIVSQLLER